MKIFTVEIDESKEFVYRLIISGQLRRGTQLSGLDWKQYLVNAKALSRTKRIVFDLTNLTYWDTGGMLELVTAVVDINRASVDGRRAGIVSPLDSHLMVMADLLNFAKTKYRDPSITEQVLPIKPDFKSLLDFLES